MSAKRLATFGERGNLQRLYFDAARPKPYYIQVGTRRKQWSFATRGEAEAFLRTEGWKLSAIAATMTQRELFTAYMDSVRRDLSPSTIRSAIYAWEKWEAFIDATAVVDAIGPMDVLDFAPELAALSAATVRTTVQHVRRVFNWGAQRGHVKANPWRDYRLKTSAAKRTKQRAEYRAGDVQKLIVAFDPTDADHWRPFVVTCLLAFYGARPGEICALEWEWVEDDGIRLPARITKTREERVLPLTPQARAVLAIAAQWSSENRFVSAENRFVLPGANDSHYTLRAYTRALAAAEERAGVPHVRFRAGHGFRRGLVGDLSDEVNIETALEAIGDRDPAMIKHYRVRRDDRSTRAIEERQERLMTIEQLRALVKTA